MNLSIRYLVSGYVESLKDELCNIVDTMYNNPETSFDTEKSCALLEDFLKNKGFNITHNVAGIKNSFSASIGDSSPCIAYICEYDALKDIGHGCGHNINCGIALGAACGLAHVLETTGGSVKVIGCPAEEMHPVKIDMLKDGVFDGVDALICAHAWNESCQSGTSLCMRIIDLTFTGCSAHTSLYPEEGIDALNPCILCMRLVDTLKSTYKDDAYINGIISDGGEQVNLIPGKTSCSFLIKSLDMDVIEDVTEAIKRCGEFSANLYSCALDIHPEGPDYLPLLTHEKLLTVACHNLKEQGIINVEAPPYTNVSLDIGNVSHKIPTVHPYIGICEDKIPYYSAEFADATVSPYAKSAMLKGACAMALTGLDVIQKPEIIE